MVKCRHLYIKNVILKNHNKCIYFHRALINRNKCTGSNFWLDQNSWSYAQKPIFFEKWKLRWPLRIPTVIFLFRSLYQWRIYVWRSCGLYSGVYCSCGSWDMSILPSKPHISRSGAVKCNQMTVTSSSNRPLPMLSIRLRENWSVTGDMRPKSWVGTR